MWRPARERRAAWIAAAAYLAITLVMTWPLARGVGRDVAWDLGDSLLNMWIVTWDGEQLKTILAGDLRRITTFFDANIFYPEARSLAFSEHLFGQAVQAFPVYVVSRNPILCYNLLFISTFVLSGLGMFLLVRELTGHTPAAFLAGLLFAFAPYRFSQAPHLQVLSAQWMPFALYGFRRYFATGRRRALAGAAAALVAQNLSCVYYLLYFTPVAMLYVLWEIGGRWRDRRMWTHLAMAAVAVVACTVPFLLPYREVRDALQFTRSTIEVERYSADVYSYATAFPASRTWGRAMRALPGRDADLFPGAIPLVLAAAAVVCWIVSVRRELAPAPLIDSLGRKGAAAFAGAAAAHLALAAYLIAFRRIDADLLGIAVRASNVTRLLATAAIASAGALALSPRARARVVVALRRPEAIFVIVLVLAWWMSLGPTPRVAGRLLDLWSPYRVLLEHVPGYEGLRVPSRFAMIVALSLSALAGLGAARLPRGRRGVMAIAILAVAFLIESHVRPFMVNGLLPLSGYVTPEARVYRPAVAPPIYRDLARVRADAVVLEMPYGNPQYDARAVYYSTVHWRKLVNGYSGFYPPNYSRLTAILAAFSRDDLAWAALGAMGVTHVVVHEGAYLDDEGVRFSAWLLANGAVEVARHSSDVLFALP
jgi:hypothetical protein